MKYGARKRTDSACSDVDTDYAQAEAELSKLHRQYRILECHRKAYLEDSRNIMRKQRSHIEVLDKDNAEVDIDLNLACNYDNAKKDKAKTISLRKLVAECNEMKEEIDGERKMIEQLNLDVGKMEDQIQDKYREIGGSGVDTDRHKSTQKHNRVLENRLYKATVVFNSTLTKNADLRDEIEHLRRERALYDSLYRKLMKEQEDIKMEMSDVIEESTHAYDSRDEAHNKMTSLRERNEKDQTHYDLEVKELKRIIDHEQNLKEFMNVKAQERAEQKAIEAAKRKKRDEMAQLPSYAEDMDKFEAVMSRIIEEGEESDLDVLVRRFVQKEDANFALFNYVNELNNEIECFQKDIKEIEDDVVVFKKQGLVLSDQRKKIMKDLEGKGTVVRNELSTTGDALKTTNKILDLVKSSIIGICRRIGCDDTSIIEKLGCADGINNENALSYLGLVEQLANEFLLVKNYQRAQFNQAKDTDTFNHFPGRDEFYSYSIWSTDWELISQESSGKGDTNQPAQPVKQAGSITTARLRPMSVASVHILPPTIEQVDEGDSGSDTELPSIDEAQPLAPELLRSRAAKLVQRKERRKDKIPPKTPVGNNGASKSDKK